ncbi:MAG: fibronectin type III domain-containing protein, partial [Bacteroidales bacterium]
MIFKTLLIATLLSVLAWPLLAQNDVVHPTILGQGTFIGISQPLKDIPPLTATEMEALKVRAEKKMLNKKLRNREYPFAETALPKGEDAAWQKTMGNMVSPKAPILNFDGQTSPYYPPDCNGTAGPNHYMQTINSTYAIYSKTGALLAGPTNMNLLFGSVTGANYNDGDPLILFDEQADRWLAVEFSISGSNDYMLIAVSTTNNPTGTWYQYSFDVADMPDYEKFGIWQDGYYMGDNNGGSNDTYVFERSAMLTGAAAPKMVGFSNSWLPTTIDGFICVPPVDNDGAFAPAGSPGLFIAMNDDAIGGGADQLWIYELAVNWTNTASSTFSRTQQINVTAFDSNFGNTWSNIPQQGTTQKVDAIPQVIMNVPQYRNFGTYQTIVCCHTVDVDATNHAGVRWYELRKTPPSTTWVVRQTGTYAPDIHSRWMGSIMLNANNKIGLGYSISSSTMYPSIRYTGQSAGAYAAGAGVMDVPEEIIQTGANSQTGVNRWGDYSLMSVDPADNETFWFTTQYIGSGGSRKTKIASFKIGNAPVATTLPATAITGNSATINGTINPNSLPTSYHFELGTTIAYGTNTATISAGTGSTSVPVFENLTGLVSGTTYHFRVVATNSDGTTNGADLTFTPGGAVVTTTAVTGIALTAAVSGGNVSTDGGSAVTARGVCWATTANPVATGNHTTDGTGTG